MMKDIMELREEELMIFDNNERNPFDEPDFDETKGKWKYVSTATAAGMAFVVFIIVMVFRYLLS